MISVIHQAKTPFDFDIINTLNASLPVGTSPTEFYAGKLKFSQNTSNLDIFRKFAFGTDISSLNVALGAEYRIDDYRLRPVKNYLIPLVSHLRNSRAE